MQILDETLDGFHAASAGSILGGALRVDGELVWTRLTGRLCVYSVTKSFTAVVVLGLARQGGLSLQDSARRWFPELPLPESITITHLLRHNSGLRDYGPLSPYHDAVRQSPSQPWTDKEFLRHTLPVGLLFEPGQGWRYSNAGYLLLRRLIEKVSGRTFEDNVRAHVVEPLGLRDTFVATGIEDWQTCLPGYGTEVSADGSLVDIRTTYHPDWCAPGVAVSSPEDVTLFYHHLLEGNLLGRKDLKLMCQMVPVPGHHPPTVKPASGMGLLADLEGPAGIQYGHGGAGPGYSISATTFTLKGRRYSLMIFANASGSDTDAPQHALIKRIIANLVES